MNEKTSTNTLGANWSDMRQRLLDARRKLKHAEWDYQAVSKALQERMNPGVGHKFDCWVSVGFREEVYLEFTTLSDGSIKVTQLRPEDPSKVIPWCQDE